MNELPISYPRLLTRLEKQEQRLLRHAPLSPLAPQLEQLRSRIPRAVIRSLERAFDQGFALLFGPQGRRFLRCTYAGEKLEEQARAWESPLTPTQARRLLADLDRQSGLSTSLGSAAAVAEGVLLGVLGIGLPDIPVLLAWLLRAIRQNAVRYGFDPDLPAEQVYLLLLLRGALTSGEERRSLSARADKLGRALDHGWPVSRDPEPERRQTAALLADRLLLVKFIQGFPLVGAVGGAANLSLSRAAARYSALKYKKRFLERKLRGL